MTSTTTATATRTEKGILAVCPDGETDRLNGARALAAETVVFTRRKDGVWIATASKNARTAAALVEDSLRGGALAAFALTVAES